MFVTPRAAGGETNRRAFVFSFPRLQEWQRNDAEPRAQLCVNAGSVQTLWVPDEDSSSGFVATLTSSASNHIGIGTDRFDARSWRRGPHLLVALGRGDAVRRL